MVRFKRLLKKTFSLAGFTMVETLLVISLLSVITLALYHTLAGGIEVWKRGSQTIEEEDIIIFFDKLNHDLRNTFSLAGLNFEGNSRGISFPSIVQTKADPMSSLEKGEYIFCPGKIEYFFDRISQRLYRRVSNYSQALEDTYGSQQLLAEKIRSVQFEYFYYENGELDWKSEIKYLDFEEKNPVFPLAVKCSVEFGNEGYQKKMTQIVNIPVVMLEKDEL